MTDHRPWKLVAPWWRWERQLVAGDAASPRQTRPVFQKFDNPGFVAGFLADPQHSLKFFDDVDQVLNVQLIPAQPLAGKLLKGIPTFFGDPDVEVGPGVTRDQSSQLEPTGRRKIFLETHRRYYLVVCELHCDGPGFPSAQLDHVCQAGFVVRRRSLKIPAGAEQKAAEILKRISLVHSQLAELDPNQPLKPSKAKKRAARLARLQTRGELAPRISQLSNELAELRAQLKSWSDDAGIVSLREGWVPSPFDRIGAWNFVEETPETLTEAFFPMYPLHPNPDLPKHDATGRAIFFGVLPASSLDTDERGNARFDSERVYEVRCFVRRHKEVCGRSEVIPDCDGELYWSEPTEAYQLAAQFDLVGTANHPVTIRMPSLSELAAQSGDRRFPFGAFSPLRVIQPETLTPQTDGKLLTGGSRGAGAICFFAIPLITIVAFFVLQLFLPIVVFLFGLWFLLVFKFCIPPSLTLAAAVDAELDTIGRLGVSVDADLQVALDLQLKLQGNADIYLSEKLPLEGAQLGEMRTRIRRLSNTPLLTLHNARIGQEKLPTQFDPTADPAIGPDLIRALAFEERVETPLVIA